MASFPSTSNRKGLFEDYTNYANALFDLIQIDFTQWINGSFISRKTLPGDIDLVSLIPFDIAERYESALINRFLNKTAWDEFGIDGYIVRIYPESHPNYHRTTTDLAYWKHWFGFSKLSKRRKRHPKGFVEMKVPFR